METIQHIFNSHISLTIHTVRSTHQNIFNPDDNCHADLGKNRLKAMLNSRMEMLAAAPEVNRLMVPGKREFSMNSRETGYCQEWISL